MCTEYYVNGEELIREDQTCWCPLTEDSAHGKAAREEFTKLLLRKFPPAIGDTGVSSLFIKVKYW